MKKRYDRIVTSVKHYVLAHSFQSVLSITFAAVLIIGLGAVVLISYFRYTSVFQNTVEQNNVRMLDQTNQYLDTYLRNQMKVSDSVYYQAVKKKDLSKESIDAEINLFYNTYQDQIVSITLFDSYGEVISATPLSKLKENVNVKEYPGFREALAQIENLHFSTPHIQNLFENSEHQYQWVVSLSRYVKINKDKKIEDGVLLVDMNFSGIEQVCRSASLGTDSYLYLIDKNGEIIYHPHQQLVYSQIEKENNVQAANYEDGSHEESFEGDSRLVTVKTVGYTGWKLVAVTPISDLTHQYFQMQGFALFIFLVAALGLFITTKIVSSKLAIPIKQLENDMLSIENGHLDTQIQVAGSSEMIHLGESINSMVSQMKVLIQNVIDEQEAKRKTELDALQTQINPHFLYNTLDSVIWMIESEHYEGAIAMITALAKLFRISLSKGKTIISLRDELQHAKNYLVIQSVRYKNKFEYEIHADEEVLGLSTIKLIVQPFIENAIYHGLESMGKDDGGKITINAYVKDDELYIDIMDNGSGMTPKTMDMLFVEKEKKKGSGIGMINVKKRIELYFGTPYGLTIFSEPDEGTLIRIHLPKRIWKGDM